MVIEVSERMVRAKCVMLLLLALVEVSLGSVNDEQQGMGGLPDLRRHVQLSMSSVDDSFQYDDDSVARQQSSDPDMVISLRVQLVDSFRLSLADSSSSFYFMELVVSECYRVRQFCSKIHMNLRYLTRILEPRER